MVRVTSKRKFSSAASVTSSFANQTMSRLERITSFPNLVLFLNNRELRFLYICNHLLQSLLSSIFVPRVTWDASGLSLLSKDSQRLVRRILVSSRKVDSQTQDVFHAWFRQCLMLCPGVISVKFGRHFNFSLPPKILPDSLTHLDLGYNFEQSLKALPSQLRSLVLSFSFSRPLPVLPPSLTDIVFGCNFRHSVKKILPPGIKSLKFYGDFPKGWDWSVVPVGLTKLKCRPNERIGPGDLPVGLKYFKAFFDSDFLGDSVFPDGLTRLNCEHSPSFDKPLEVGRLPSSLTRLSLGAYNPIGKGVLPAGLTRLVLGDNFQQQLDATVLPAGLRRLSFGSKDDYPFSFRMSMPKFNLHQSLPAGLNRIRFSIFNQPLSQGMLPSSLTCLCLSSYFERKLLPGVLPLGLKKFSLTTDPYEHSISTGVLPPDLVELCLGSLKIPLEVGDLPQKLLRLTAFHLSGLRPGTIPTGLQHLNLTRYDFPLDPGILPASLIKFKSGNYNLPLIPASLPDNLQILSLRSFACPLPEGVLPPSLTKLKLCHERGKMPLLHECVFPPSLVTLKLNYKASQNFDASLLPLGANLSNDYDMKMFDD